MKQNIILLLCLFLMSSTCKKEDCHYHINIINESSEDIVWGINVSNSADPCNIDGQLLKSDDEGKYYPYNGCIESHLKGKRVPLVIYIIDPDSLSEPYIFYDCDSINYHDEILRRYELDITYLEQNDYTIKYP